MKTNNGLLLTEVQPKYHAIVTEMNRYDLEDLEIAIQTRRIQIMAKTLENRGFRTRIEAHGQLFGYVMIYDPNEINPGEWASLNECQRLLDTVSNLPPMEAFARWKLKIEPFEKTEYTKSDAIADMKRERAEARQRYESGIDNAEDFKIAWSNARTCLDNVTK